MKYLRLKLITLFVIVFSFFSAGAQTDDLATGIAVYKKEAKLPASAKKIGSVKVGDGFRFVCGYDVTLEDVKRKAAEMGGNAIQLTSVKAPDLMSTCYRMKADVYTIAGADMPVLQVNKKQFEDSVVRKLIPDTASYALLYVYRPKSSLGPLVQYNLHVDDSVVCRVKYNDKHIIRLNKAGSTLLWARTESRKELSLDVKYGKVYFLRCGVKFGVMVGEPEFEIVSTAFGMDEFERTGGPKD